MTWTLVQKSTQATVSSGSSITPAFTGGTTAGNLLVAVLAASGSTSSWTLPGGWVQGTDLYNGPTHVSIWYYIGNPGGITGVLCSNAQTATLKGAVAEFHTDVAGATVVANAQGTGSAGTVASCTATTSTPATSGDLAVGCFMERFSTGTAITWTDPSGFTQVVADTASSGNHQYSAYDLGTGSGTLNVTVTSSAASDLTSGWAGAVQTFTPQVLGGPSSAWSQVQKSASQASAALSTTVTGTLPSSSAGSGTRTHLVTAFLLASGGGSWTLPAGWQMAADVTNGGYIRASIAYFRDTGTNVGTSTVFTYSSSQNLKCLMAEYDPGADGLAVSLNAAGTGLAGAVSSCTVSSGTAAASGDLAVCAFAEHFTSSTALTWTDPSGWALVGSDSASAGNHQYCAQDLSAAAGTMSVTAKTSVASTSANAWAGTVATFTAGALVPAGSPGLVGAYINPGMYGSGTTLQQAISKWQANAGRTLSVRRQYYGLSGFPSAITSDLKADVAAARKVCLSFRPAYSPVSAADLAGLDGFLSSCKTAGLVGAVALWMEPYYIGLTASQYIAGVKYYGPTIRQYYPLFFLTSASAVNNNNENSYYPGSAYVDGVSTDFYWGSYHIDNVRFGSGTSKDPALHADRDGLPFGLWEFATSTDPTQGITPSQATSFCQYIQTYFSQRLGAGKDNADLMWFNSNTLLDSETPIVVPDGQRDPFSPGNTEYRNALYDGVYDLVAAAPPSTVTVTTTSLPGATQGGAYSVQLAASGGTAPYTWAITAGALPTGLSLAASTGIISGTPTTTVGSPFSFTVQATDSVAATGSQALSITVTGTLSVTTVSLPDAIVGTGYSQALSASGGNLPYTWALAAGALPPGLSLNKSTGVISGTASG